MIGGIDFPNRGIRVALSDTAARKAKGRDKPYKLADAGGLYLLVKPDAAKYWRLKYRHAGKERLLAIGVYPQTSLAEARQAREDAKRLIKQGLDPVTYRKQQRHVAEANAANTFGAVAREWLEKYGHRWVPIHLERVSQSLKLNVLPDLENRPIREITAPELLATMRRVEHRGALDMAQRVLQRCSAVFRYGVAAGHCDRNPAADLRGALKPPKRGNFASLAAVDLPEYLKKLETYDGKIETRLALRLLLQTFVRTTELRAAEWTEFDIDAAEWRIPAARMKMGAEHIVPLSMQALALLEELRPLTGHSRFLFPNQANPQTCMSENTMLYALYRMGYHSRATGHGFRTTASTILNEQGFDADAIERQLAHAERNKVRAAYNKAEYLPARRKMMQAWADYLDGIAAGAKVKPIRRAA
jgi:integrase